MCNAVAAPAAPPKAPGPIIMNGQVLHSCTEERLELVRHLGKSGYLEQQVRARRDGGARAASGRTPEIVLFDTTTLAVTGRRYGGTGYHWRMAFTPDGGEIVVAAGFLVKYPTTLAFPRELRSAFPGIVSAKPSIDWVDGGSLLVATGPYGELDVLDPAIGASTRLVEGGADSLGTGGVDPTGRYLVVAGTGRPTLLVDRRTGGRTELPEIGRGDLGFSPSGARMLYTGADRRYVVVDVAGGRVEASVEIPIGNDSFGSVWLDERRCVTGGSNRRALVELGADGLWSSRPIDSQGVSVFTPIPEGKDGLRFAASNLAPKIQGLRSFDPARAGDAARVELAEVTESPRVYCGSPDGTLIAAGGSDPRIVIYDRERALALGSFPVADRITDLAFSPDGQTLAAIDYRGRILLFDTRTAAEREAIRRRRIAELGIGKAEFREALAAAGSLWVEGRD